MMAGILLHGVLSFIPQFPWPVSDSQTGVWAAWIFFGVHGFRMPLFFLISGFFTMMLFQKRGLGALLWHRFRRIFLPLLLGLVTIIPLTRFVGDFVMRSAIPETSSQKITPNRDGEGQPVVSFWEGVATGNAKAVQSAIDSATADVNGFDPTLGGTPLTMASFLGHGNVVKVLIDAGADVNKFDKHGAAPMHNAVFRGDFGIWHQLRTAGGDHTAKKPDGTTMLALVDLDWGTTNAIASFVKIPLDKEKVLAGRELIRADLVGLSLIHI